MADNSKHAEDPNYAPMDAAWDVAPREGEGRYTGVGPRRYRRSDTRIVEDVNEALTQHPHVDATNIGVRCEDGTVTLDGSVASRACKRAAEDTAFDTAGVRDVQNRLRIEEEKGLADNTTGIDEVAELGMKDSGDHPVY